MALGKGRFWPISISDFSLSVVRMFGTCSTFTSVLVCSACTTIPNIGGSTALAPPAWPKIEVDSNCLPISPPTRPLADSRPSGFSELSLSLFRPPTTVDCMPPTSTVVPP